MGYRWEAIAGLAVLLARCGVPVHVTTPKPIDVDVTVRMDIYQHRTAEADDAVTSAPTADAGTSDEETRRRERIGQIQAFKNSRLVGENHSGQLAIIRLPPGDYGKQVEQLVTAENDDRTTLMRTEAAARRVPLATIEAEQASQWRAHAFPGEWIEEQQPDKTWHWVQKRPDQPAPATLEPPPTSATP